MKICPICKKEFIQNSNSQKYCSLKCVKIVRIKYMKNYRLKNKKQIKEYRLQYYKKYYQKIKEYYRKNKIKINLYSKKHYLKNKESIKKHHYQYRKKKIKININFRILERLRVRIYGALKNDYKSNSTRKLIGCNIKQLKKHLEKQFTKGMTWANYGKWHIDHIKPCASFDLSKPSEQRKCFHYTNLQPLWAKDNMKKHTNL